MRAEELMLGDWVSHNGEIHKVGRGDFINAMLTTRCSPIPITPEILENNGFTIGMYSYCYIGEEEYLEYYRHKSRLSLYWKGVDEWESHTIQKELLGRCNVVYVHELQHALRMFGIKKEIKL